MNRHTNRHSYLNGAARLAAAAAILLGLGGAACGDLTVAPKSTITSGNIFDDPASYRSFLAKLYGGLSLTGQSGPDGSADIQGIDEGFSQYVRLIWQMEELPTHEPVTAWNDEGVPQLNTITSPAPQEAPRGTFGTAVIACETPDTTSTRRSSPS